METWIAARLAEIRERVSARDESSLWVIFFDDPRGAPILAVAVEGTPDELSEEELRNLAAVVDGGGANAVLYVVPRRSGLPRPVDRQLWVAVQSTRTTALDLLVVGQNTHWSAIAEDRGASRDQRRASARTSS